MITDFTTATPAEIDTESAPIREAHAEAWARYTAARKREGRVDDAGDAVALAKARADITAAEAEMDALNAQFAPYAAEYERRGGWTRAYEVVSSPDGHIHRTTRCATTRFTTRFRWLTEVSGWSESAIIAAAGEMACTACYPNAPVDVLKRAARIGSSVERRQAQAERAAERNAKAAKAAEKGITNPDGTELRDSGGFVVKTEVSALREYLNMLVWGEDWGSADLLDHAARILAALAHKHDVTPEEMAKTLAPKVAAKRRREARQARR